MLPTKTLKASQRRLHSGAIRCEMLRPLGDVLTKLKENKIMHSQRIEQNELRKKNMEAIDVNDCSLQHLRSKEKNAFRGKVPWLVASEVHLHTLEYSIRSPS